VTICHDGPPGATPNSNAARQGLRRSRCLKRPGLYFVRSPERSRARVLVGAKSGRSGSGPIRAQFDWLDWASSLGGSSSHQLFVEMDQPARTKKGGARMGLQQAYGSSARVTQHPACPRTVPGTPGPRAGNEERLNFHGADAIVQFVRQGRWDDIWFSAERARRNSRQWLHR